MVALESRFPASTRSDLAAVRSDMAAMEQRIMDNADRAYAQIAGNIDRLAQRFDRHLESHAVEEAG